MHNIVRFTCDEKANRKSVMTDIQRVAENDGDGYWSKMTWHDEVAPLESYEKAEEWINAHDRGNYDDHAVRFKDYSKAVKTKKMSELEGKIESTRQAFEKLEKESQPVNSRTSEFIGCAECGSKVARSYLKSSKCPVCNADLRSKTVLSRLDGYKSKIKEYSKRIDEEKKKQKNSCRILWLVKYEYHS